MPPASRSFPKLHLLGFGLSWVGFSLTIAPPSAQARSNAIMIKVNQGEAFYTPPRETAIRVGTGQTLQRIRSGGSLKTGSNTRVVVFCTPSLPIGIGANESRSINRICPGRADIQLGDFTFPRGGIDASVPYLISPRYSFTSDRCPTLRWNPVAGSRSYTVTLFRLERGRNLPVWSTQHPSTPTAGQTAEGMSYPFCGQTPLQAGVTYSFRVVTDQGLSSDSEAPRLDDYRSDQRGGIRGLNFRLLSPEQVNKIRQEGEKRAAAAELTPVEKTIVLANWYADNNLYTDAIALLETLLPKARQEPNLHRTLGDLYAQVGLNRNAKQFYEQAIVQATQRKNNDEMKTAQEGLANLCKKSERSLCL
jgi:hypothetical protein